MKSICKYTARCYIFHISYFILDLNLEINLFADFGPGLLQPVDGTAVEGRGDLQHTVVVVEAATDICHRQPLLNGAGSGA